MVLLSNGSYSYPSTQARDHLINAIGDEGAANSENVRESPISVSLAFNR